MGRVRSQDVRERPDVELVVAARAGDPQAVEHLVRGCLPLVYNIVGRALDGHSDVDDVVQDTMLRALDGLPGLEEPERFRSWLVAIAVRQVRDRWRSRQARPQSDLPDEAVQEVAPEADFADLAILRLALSGQRREAVEATRWLEDEEREVLSLWWLEAAGELTRAELAAACDLAPQHAAVRVQRVKERLESGRAVVRALAASPRCAELDAQLTSWDGRPNARWRKRLARHVRDCPQCLFTTSELVPTEGLLGGFALVPVPIGLAGLLLAKSMPSASAAGGAAHAPGGAGRVGHLLAKLAAKPVVTLTAGAVALVGGGAVYAYTRSDAPVRPPTAKAQPHAPASPAVSSAPPTPTASATPSPTPTAPSTLLGRHALRSAGRSGHYVREVGNLGFLGSVATTSPGSAKREATFRFVTGLADSRCYSIEDASGRYLRHYAFRIRLDANDGSAVFQKDATFCARPGSTDGSVSLESYNYPGRYLRYRDNLQLWVDAAQNTAAFRASRSFTVVAPWT
ncbi:sigma-70 family RNA polymerase sigma factor [Streptomyces sp. NBC_01515]|uniref:sigma-70 family RNA polymerase sigma factor n=1 Tax=Streptomyces sp. NBC_01515 TaxID=2903890 RepID=UPI0038651318